MLAFAIFPFINCIGAALAAIALFVAAGIGDHSLRGRNLVLGALAVTYSVIDFAQVVGRNPDTWLHLGRGIGPLLWVAMSLPPMLTALRWRRTKVSLLDAVTEARRVVGE